MAVEVVEYSAMWSIEFERVAADLHRALASVPGAVIEHVGSTSVPGLAAKPIVDIDVIVEPDQMPSAIDALQRIGYQHRGDLGLVGREAFIAPDDAPRRHVYVCESGSLNVRNHLAVRDVLRRRDDLRDAYATVKRELASDAGITIDTYIARKSEILQAILAESDLTDDERRQIWTLNNPQRQSGTTQP